MSSQDARLKQLEELYAANFIPQEEYHRRRLDILRETGGAPSLPLLPFHSQSLSFLRHLSHLSISQTI